ncbi:lipopolysaccharide biosynthesis protein [Cetobacterium sp.]|uniref:lipopolysaccharide biosynthesis protein n=1 Tax=Cetobacterium sp. TaxID=2071632 RepID=UPI003F2AD6CA
MKKNKVKIKVLIENFLFFGILTIISKAFPLLTIPIITRLLPDAKAFGLMDMFTIIISFGAALAIPGFGDLLYRDYFQFNNDKKYQNELITTTFLIALLNSLVIVGILLLFGEKISILLFKNYNTSNIIYLGSIGIILSVSSTIGSLPLRMENKKKIFLATSILVPIITFMITVYLINLGYGYKSLIYSQLVNLLLASCIYIYMSKEYYFQFKINKKITIELFKIGTQMLPTCLIYWIFNSIDRIMINRLLGPKALGIFAIGAKIALISQVIYVAFSNSWSYFAFSTMKNENQIETISKIFELLGIVCMVIYIILLPVLEISFEIFFIGDYIKGKEVVPYLFLSPLILMLFQILGSQVIIIKKAYITTISLSIGALSNIIFNTIAIKNFGIKGAAIVTLVSYVISLIILSIFCIKQKILFISTKTIIINLIFYIGIFFQFKYNNYYLLYLLLFYILVFFSRNLYKNIKNIIP